MAALHPPLDPAGASHIPASSLSLAHVPLQMSADLPPLSRARQALHLSVVPASLPCRQEEMAQIGTIVESALVNSLQAVDAESGTLPGGACLFVSGMPGTGKTTAVLEAVRMLRSHARQTLAPATPDASHIPPFQFVEINALRLRDPSAAYSELALAVLGQKFGANRALAQLDAHFGSPPDSRLPVVLLLDEVDHLLTKKQTVVYNLFDWPQKPGSRLIIVAIANTMNLPEKLLLPRVTSRLGMLRVDFASYTSGQIDEILRGRLAEAVRPEVDLAIQSVAQASGISIDQAMTPEVLAAVQGAAIDALFDPAARGVLATLVANMSGDARRALEIARRAADAADNEGGEKVLPRHVHQIAQRVFYHQAAEVSLSGLPIAQRLFMAAVHLEQQAQRTQTKRRTSGSVGFVHQLSGDVLLWQVCDRIRNMCQLSHRPVPSSSDVQLACHRLASQRLVITDSASLGLHARVKLNTTLTNVEQLIQELGW